MSSRKCYVIGILCFQLFVSITTVSNSFPNATKSGKNQGIYSFHRCNEEQFQCQYGACIEIKYLCDGLKQCIDGSDESPEMCNVPLEQPNRKRTRRQADKMCAVPASSPDKTISYVCNPPSATCGTLNGYVAELTVAYVTCATGYHRDNLEIGPKHFCHDSQWSPKIDKCVKKCDQLNLVNNVVFHCSRYGLNIENCNGSSLLLAGTKVRPICEPAYKYDTSPDYYEITCNDDGKWDNNLFSCVPECGKPYTQAQLTIFGGTPEAIGGSPWHVAIFNKDRVLICGGSIISESLVLSAAHCFSDDEHACEGTNCIDDYEVVVGKYTNNYTVQDNPRQKTMKIKEIRFPKKGYRGLPTYHAADMAILILQEKIHISPAILPICLNWMDLKNGKYPSEGELGKVVGWGRIENNTYSTVLRKISLPFISYQRCVDMVHSDFQPFVTLDKFCAGTGNDTGATLMDGDSGGGIVFEEKNLFYLRGVVSVKSYSSNSVNVFTDLSDHIDWISSTRDEIEKKLPKKGIYSNNNAGNYPTIYQPYTEENIEKKIHKEIIGDIKSQDSASATHALQQGITDTFKNSMNKLYNSELSNFELLLRFAESVQDYEQKLELYNALHNKIRSSGHQMAWRLHLLRDSVKKEILDQISGATAAQLLYDMLWDEMKESSVELISFTFQNDTAWPLAKQLSAEIENSCKQCTMDIYNKVVETVWNNVTVPELLQRARTNFKNIEEEMILHIAIINKLKHNNITNVCVVTTLARSIKEVMGRVNYKNAVQDRRTKYEELYNKTETTIIQETIRPISFAFQNNTSWVEAKQLSDDIHGKCKQYFMDIYKEVVDTVWNKVSIPNLLKRIQTNLKNVMEDMMVHTVIINKLKDTHTLNASSAAALVGAMKHEMDKPSYKNVLQVNRTDYETLYNDMMVKIQEMVGSIYLTLRFDTPVRDFDQLSADLYESCKQCMVIVYNKALNLIPYWDDITIPNLLHRAGSNLNYIEEVMLVHTFIINKLQREEDSPILSASLAAELASAMEIQMDKPEYQNVPQVNRTNYEALYKNMLMKTHEMVGPILSAFQSNTSWEKAKQLERDVAICKQCTTNIYTEVIDTVWGKLAVPELLQRVQQNILYIEEIVIIHTAIINKLKSRGPLTTSVAATMARCMKEEMDMRHGRGGYLINIPQDVRINYEILYLQMMAYDQSINNFKSQLSFINSVEYYKSYKHKYELYHTLHKEIKNSDDQTAWRLYQLRESVKKEILDHTTANTTTHTSTAARMLYDKLWNEILDTSTKQISTAFISDTLWVMVKELGGYIYDNCQQCSIDIYSKVVEVVWNKVSLTDILNKTLNNLKYVEEMIAVHEAVINKFKSTNTLTASSAASLADAMKVILAVPPYENRPQKWRSTYEILYNSMKDFKKS